MHVYCGPTITAAEVLDMIPAAITHPPVRHGDLIRLHAGAGDTVVIIDGVFHAAPPVRHKEILDLLSRGVRVVGAASMGALRAAELYPYGMTGIGSIFADYRDGLIDADDEVAVAHTADGNQQLSEALADMRAVVALAVTEGILDRLEARRITDYARGIHYTKRSWNALRYASAADPGFKAVLQRLADWRAAHTEIEGAKHADAVAALRQVADGNLPPSVDAAWLCQPWRTFHLQHWIACYRGIVHEGVCVPFLAALQHQQLYDPGFPRRWRRHVMSWIAATTTQAAGSPAGTEDIESDAVAAAAAKGLILCRLSAAQLAYWLTSDEMADLADAEKLARILVRSVPQDPAAAIWPAAADDAPWLLARDIDSTGAALAAFRRNAEIAGSGPGRSIHELRKDMVLQHLADRWGIDPADERSLTAAARDRGFYDAASAAEAARSFFLSAVHLDLS